MQHAKDAGNVELKAGRYDAAVEKYSAAIAVYDQASVFVDSSDVSICYSNRALAQLKLGNNEDGMKDALQAVCFNPEYAKAHHRCGAALKALGRVAEAEDAMQTAVLIDKRGMTYKDARALIKNTASRKKAALKKEEKKQKAQEKAAHEAQGEDSSATASGNAEKAGTAAEHAEKAGTAAEDVATGTAAEDAPEDDSDVRVEAIGEQ